MNNNVHRAELAGDITWEEIVYSAEFCSWTVLALTPFLRWANGPSVSTDQNYMRIGLVVVAAFIAIASRLTKLYRSRIKKIDRPLIESEDTSC